VLVHYSSSLPEIKTAIANSAITIGISNSTARRQRGIVAQVRVRLMTLSRSVLPVAIANDAIKPKMSAQMPADLA
jgi:hypothetical protein